MNAKLSRRSFLTRSVIASAGASLAVGAESAYGQTASPAAAAPKVAPASKGSLPTGKIGKLTVSRLISGGNLISGWAHSRDLHYVPSLMRAYNTPEKVMDTLQLLEEHGVNAIIDNNIFEFADNDAIRLMADPADVEKLDLLIGTSGVPGALAIAKEEQGELEVRVHPTMIPESHLLASVGGVYNAVHIRGDSAGSLMFSGRGAGQMPTASSVVEKAVIISTTVSGERSLMCRSSSSPVRPLNTSSIPTCSVPAPQW